jgi:hypothetical protein
MKTACIVQGNIRTNTDIVLSFLSTHFEYIILSTWEDEKIDFIVDLEKYYLVRNVKPIEAGYSNRNFQRLSTFSGIVKAKELGCEYVMKWRTDMLPINLDIKHFFKLANTDIPSGMPSRIVTCAFRNLSVEPDWFSSIPDIFAFGHIDMVEILWGAEDFDYSSSCNIPEDLRISLDWEKFANNIEGNYCAETELYAIFKNRLQRLTKFSLIHEQIVKRYFHIIDHKKLSIIWFGNNGEFRPIISIYFPWWKVENWEGFRKVKTIRAGYPTSLWWRVLSKYILFVLTKVNSIHQSYLFNRYLKALK